MAGQLACNGNLEAPEAQRWTPVKRLVDVVGASVALAIFSPLMVVLAFLIRLDSHGNALYKSQRLTCEGRPFFLYKFRTMYEGSPARHGPDGSLIVESNDPRLTRMGRLLRQGLDELPQFANVLHGDMSIVGPRADPPEALHTYLPDDFRRLSVRPGITGLAQVSGRTNIPLEKRRTYDLLYVTAWRPRLDFYICLLTIFELIPGLDRRLSRVRRYLERTLTELIATCHLSSY